MAQGDVAGRIGKMIGELNILTASSNTAQFDIERSINEVIDYYEDILDSKKEANKWDAKNETLGEYFKKVYKKNIELNKKRKDLKKEISFIGEQIENYDQKIVSEQKKGNSGLAKVLFKKKLQLEIEKEIKGAMDDISDTVKNAEKSGNPYVAALMLGIGLVIDVGKALARAAIGMVKTIFNFTKDILGVDMGIGAIFKMFLDMQKLSGNISANLGLIAKESEAFLFSLPSVMNQVLLVGGSLEDIGEAVMGFNKMTNKNRVFTPEQFKKIIELGLGTGLGVGEAAEFIGNFDNLGLSLDKTLEFTDSVRKTTMGVSQNQTKVLRKVGELITELSGYGISEGLKGLTNLVVKTERLRFDVKRGVASFKDAFTNPEKAIDVAATARLLGGKFSNFFSDPFRLMGDSMYDPQKLVSDLVESMKDKAHKKNGMFIIEPADRIIIKEFAKAFGQNGDELMGVAIEQAKDADKIEALRKKGLNVEILGDRQKTLILNLLTLENNDKYSLRLPGGAVKMLEEIPSNKILRDYLEQDRKNEQSAILRKDLMERIGLAIEQFNVGFSKFFIHLNKLIGNSGAFEKLDQITEYISGTFMKKIDDFFNSDWLKFINKGLEIATKIYTNIMSVFIDKDTPLTEGISKAVSIVITNFKKYVMPWLKLYAGKLVEWIGKTAKQYLPGNVGRKIEKAGLSMQMNAVIESSKYSTKKDKNGKIVPDQSLMSKLEKDDLLKKIDEYNQSSGDPELDALAKKAGLKSGLALVKKPEILYPLLMKSPVMTAAILTVSSKLGEKSVLKAAGKAVAKKVPLIGLAIGIWDAIGQAMEGDYGQAALSLASGIASTVPGVGTAVSVGLDATNAYIDYKEDKSINKSSLMNVKDAYISANGELLKGGPGDILLKFNEIAANQGFLSNPNTINLVLGGKVKHKDNNNSFSRYDIKKKIPLISINIIKQIGNNSQNTA
jgi:hypothetical protein